MWCHVLLLPVIRVGTILKLILQNIESVICGSDVFDKIPDHNLKEH